MWSAQTDRDYKEENTKTRPLKRVPERKREREREKDRRVFT